jgi:hypothetical protein
LFEVEKLVRNMMPPALWKCGIRSSRPPSEVAVIGFGVLILNVGLRFRFAPEADG